MKKIIKNVGYFVFTLIWLICVSSNFVWAAEFAIIPEETDIEAVKKTVETIATRNPKDNKETVWDRYNVQANRPDKELGLGDKLAAWTLNWDTLLDYVVYLVRFLSQVGILIGAIMILYAGYMYATDVMGWDASKWKTAIKNAIIGVVVVSFSYALIRILTNMFIE